MEVGADRELQVVLGDVHRCLCATGAAGVLISPCFERIGDPGFHSDQRNEIVFHHRADSGAETDVAIDIVDIGSDQGMGQAQIDIGANLHGASDGRHGQGGKKDGQALHMRIFLLLGIGTKSDNLKTPWRNGFLGIKAIAF